MKKVLYSAALLLLATLTSCEKEDIENTATVNMAGQWYVQVDAVDAMPVNPLKTVKTILALAVY